MSCLLWVHVATNCDVPCVCCDCRGKLQNCPLCRDHFSETSCLLAKNVVRKIKFSCKYKGCERSLHFQSVKSHAAQCRYHPLWCPFASMVRKGCSWEGNAHSFKWHIQKMHYLCAKNRNISVTCSSMLTYCNQESNNCKWRQAMFRLGESFLVNIKMTDFNLHFCLHTTF